MKLSFFSVSCSLFIFPVLLTWVYLKNGYISCIHNHFGISTGFMHIIAFLLDLFLCYESCHFVLFSRTGKYKGFLSVKLQIGWNYSGFILGPRLPLPKWALWNHCFSSKMLADFSLWLEERQQNCRGLMLMRELLDLNV